MIALIDYGAGNVRSVHKALQTVGAEVRLCTGPAGLADADKVVLPGVGAFGHAMHNLARQHLIGAVKEAATSGKPFLGICLGMQLLFETSEEFGRFPGLGIFRGKVRRFAKNLKVPHMGWNSLSLKRRHPYFQNIADGTYMYFVHSYYCDPEDKDVLLATTAYGIEVAAAVGRGNLCATQFHPEKSQNAGLKIYQNFAHCLDKAR